MASANPNNVLNTVPAALRIVATNEKVTGPPAAEMLRLALDGPPNNVELVDLACGGGILTAEAMKLATARPEIVLHRNVAVDLDDNMIQYVERRIKESSWRNVETLKADQQSLSLPDNSFSHVFSNLGIFFAPNDGAALSETLRILKHEGIAGFTSWKAITWWSSLAKPALASLVPDAPPLPEPGDVFPVQGWTDPTAIPVKLEKAGFKDVKVSEYTFTPDVEAEEFAEACAVLVKVITKRLWSEEDNAKYGEQIEPALLKYLQQNFPNGKWNGKMVSIISIAEKP